MIQTLSRRSTRPLISRSATCIKTIAPVFMAFFLVSLMACNLCGNTEKGEAISPDGRLVARVSERDCGATTDYSSVVNLQTPSAKFDPNDEVLFVAKGQHDISVRWLADKELLLTCTSCSRKDVFREVTVTGDIDIRYAAN